MSATTSLDEINLKIRDAMFHLFHTISPRDWDSRNRVFLLADDDKDYAFQIYQRRAKDTSMSYPICTVTRDPVFDDTNDLSYTPHLPEVVGSDPDNSDKQIKYVFLPIKTTYQISIYHDSRRKCEEIIQDIMFIRGDTQRILYKSDIISSNDLLEINIIFSEIPSYTMIPGKADRDKGDGYIYKLNIPLRAEGVLFKQTSNLNKILTIINDVYLNMPSEASEDNKETYIIT